MDNMFEHMLAGCGWASSPPPPLGLNIGGVFMCLLLAGGWMSNKYRYIFPILSMLRMGARGGAQYSGQDRSGRMPRHMV